MTPDPTAELLAEAARLFEMVAHGACDFDDARPEVAAWLSRYEAHLKAPVVDVQTDDSAWDEAILWINDRLDLTVANCDPDSLADVIREAVTRERAACEKIARAAMCSNHSTEFGKGTDWAATWIAKRIATECRACHREPSECVCDDAIARRSAP